MRELGEQNKKNMFHRPILRVYVIEPRTNYIANRTKAKPHQYTCQWDQLKLAVFMEQYARQNNRLFTLKANIFMDFLRQCQLIRNLEFSVNFHVKIFLAGQAQKYELINLPSHSGCIFMFYIAATFFLIIFFGKHHVLFYAKKKTQENVKINKIGEI